MGNTKEMEGEEEREEEDPEEKEEGGAACLKSALKFSGSAARTIGTVRRELWNGVIVSVCVKMKQCSRRATASLDLTGRKPANRGKSRV